MTFAGGSRPQGLVTLAICNFVFGGIGMLVAIVRVSALLQHSLGIDPDSAETNVPIAYTSVILALAANIMLLLAGIGYLKRHRLLGFWMAILYAVCGLTSTTLHICTAHYSMDTILGLSYPLFTLFFIGVVFRRDLAA